MTKNAIKMCAKGDRTPTVTVSEELEEEGPEIRRKDSTKCPSLGGPARTEALMSPGHSLIPRTSAWHSRGLSRATLGFVP